MNKNDNFKENVIEDYESAASKLDMVFNSYKNEEGNSTAVDYGYDSRSTMIKEQTRQVITIISTFMKPVITAFLYVLITLSIVSFIKNYLTSFLRLDISTLPSFGPYFWFMIVSPFAVWLYSTDIEPFSFHSPKRLTLIMMIGNVVIRLSSIVYYLSYRLFLPGLVRVPTDEQVTAEMVISFTYIVLFIIQIIFALMVGWFIHALFTKSIDPDKMNEFKMSHMSSGRTSRYEYDHRIVKNVNDGKKITVHEIDRYLHSFILGATGTGKTSMILIAQIYSDLITRKRNISKAKRAIKRMVEKGEAYINRPFDDMDFAYEYFTPNAGYEKKYEKIKKKYQLIGITLVAPDNDTTDKVCSLFEAFKINYNRIDPQPDEFGQYKTNFKGFNLLAVSHRMPKWERSNAISKKATLLADVMQQIFESSGKSDPYFSSVNRIATRSIAFLLMVTYYDMTGKHPTVGNVEELLIDFSKISAYTRWLRENDKEKKYTTILDIMRVYFEQNDKFREHCSGLIAQFNNLLSNDLLRNVLCSDDTVDLDEILSNSRMTVVNIALGPLGAVGSPSFGRFFMNSFIDSVIRRPGTENTRAPHSLSIDEFPVIVDENFGAMFTLFRKLRVMVSVCAQGMSQFRGKMEYMKDVLLINCSHQYVFGRAAIEEMEIYSKLSGERKEFIHQVTHSSGSIFETNSKQSVSDRSTPNVVANAEETKIRFRDFKELTFFTVSKGRPLPAIHAKANFIPRYATMKKLVYRVDWSKYYAPAKDRDEFSTAAEVKNQETKPFILSSGKKYEDKIESVTEVQHGQANDSLVEEQRNGDISIRADEKTNEHTVEQIVKVHESITTGSQKNKESKSNVSSKVNSSSSTSDDRVMTFGNLLDRE